MSFITQYKTIQPNKFEKLYIYHIKFNTSDII